MRRRSTDDVGKRDKTPDFDVKISLMRATKEQHGEALDYVERCYGEDEGQSLAMRYKIGLILTILDGGPTPVTYTYALYVQMLVNKMTWEWFKHQLTEWNEEQAIANRKKLTAKDNKELLAIDKKLRMKFSQKKNVV